MALWKMNAMKNILEPDTADHIAKVAELRCAHEVVPLLTAIEDEVSQHIGVTVHIEFKITCEVTASKPPADPESED